MQLLEAAIERLFVRDSTFLETLAPSGRVARAWSGRQIGNAAGALCSQLLAIERSGASVRSGGLRVAVVCANSAEFVIADLACWCAGHTEVPLPLAFSSAQATSLLLGVSVCLVDTEGERCLAAWGLGSESSWQVLRVDTEELCARSSAARVRRPASDWICKIVHTSGTTSTPKGVQIRAFGLEALLRSLDDAMPAMAFSRYLSTVPLSLLIEQVTAIYMVLLHDGVLVLPPAGAPLVGSSVDAARDILPLIAAARPSAMVVAPVLVEALHQAAVAARQPLAEALFGTPEVPLLCCGGAPIRAELLRDLDAMGLTVHEGYGLSENGSVVAWNRPGSRRIGSVGTPLAHVTVRLGDDDELLVRSTSLFAGYTADDPSSCVLDTEGWLHTGDIASIDEDGFIYITGRKKNVIITSSGRNIAPEWVEAQYSRLPFVTAVAVVGNQLPVLHGLFLVASDMTLEAARDAIVEFGARHLSSVERVQVLCLQHASNAVYRRFFTVTGRARRAVVEAAIAANEWQRPALTASPSHDRGN